MENSLKTRIITDTKRALIISLVFNGLFLAAVLCCFRPYFLSNDDYVIMGITSGASGFFEYRAVYINPLLALLLNGLYMLVPFLPWYALLQYLLIFSGFTAIGFVSVRRWAPIPALTFCAVLLAFFGLDAYVAIHYTKTTAIAALSGLYLMYHADELSGQKLRRLLMALGLVLALSGMLYRSMQFFACGAIFCFVFIDRLLPRFSACREDKQRLAGEILSGLKPFVLLLVMSIALSLVDKAAYSGEDWQAYQRYNEARTALMDYDRLVPYEEHAAEYEQLGISPELFELVARWDFLDTELIDTESFEKMYALGQASASGRSISGYVSACIPGFVQHWAFSALLAFGLCWLLFGRKDLRSLLSLAGLALGFAAVSLLLYFRGRHSVAWVDYGWLLAAALALLWFMPPLREKKGGPLSGALVLLCGAVLFAVYFPGWSGHFHRAQLRANPELTEFSAMLESRSELILADTYFGDLYINQSPFSTKSLVTLENLVYMGGWEAEYPAHQKTLASFDISNPYRDCVDNEKVLLLTAHIELTLEHIRSAYCPTAQAVPVAENTESIPYGLYRIIS